jgi:hypothetical protein
MPDRSHERKAATTPNKLAPIPAGHLERMLGDTQQWVTVSREGNIFAAPMQQKAFALWVISCSIVLDLTGVLS